LKKGSVEAQLLHSKQGLEKKRGGHLSTTDQGKKRSMLPRGSQKGVAKERVRKISLLPGRAVGGRVQSCRTGGEETRGKGRGLRGRKIRGSERKNYREKRLLLRLDRKCPVRVQRTPTEGEQEEKMGHIIS